MRREPDRAPNTRAATSLLSSPGYSANAGNLVHQVATKKPNAWGFMT